MERFTMKIFTLPRDLYHGKVENEAKKRFEV